jgi:ABC-type transport system substrate-binding protein
MIGTKLSDRYEIVSELGRGGMGVVYRARDPMLNREVAVKLIPPSQLSPEAERRFQSEARVVAQMDHPGIVPIHDLGQHEGSLFFVMPVVEGTSLRQIVRDAGLTLGEVVDIGIQVAEALEYSHGRGVVHRDIKPENIMVTRDESGGVRVRVMDFGLARASNVSSLTRTGTLVGTMCYVSPEQVKGEEIDGRADVYSLGTVLYESVSNGLPFTGELQSVLYRIVHELPQPLRERGAEIDDELDVIILGCLAKEPEKRPPSAGELARRLRAYHATLRDSDRTKSIVATRSMVLPRPAASPFVGRDEQIKELQQRLNNAVDGKCQFVVISGEAGVGKTRLLDELETLARARQIRVLHGRFVEHEAAFPYYGFCEAIQEYFQQKEAGSSSASGSPDLSDLAADLVSLFPMRGEIEAVRSAAGGDSQLIRPGESRSPESRTQIFELLARTLTRLASGRPLVLLFEELHGADVSVEALQYIVRRLGPTPTLVVGTYRSTEVDKRHPLVRMLAGFRGDRQFASIGLEPFSPAEHRSFLATLIGGDEIVGNLAWQLYEASEGNPFFTKELVRSLLDAGNIVQDETGAWALSGGVEISSDALPATIQQAVEERVGRLPEELRQVLSVASVMGRSFDFRDLESLARDEDDLDDAVDRLVTEGLIEEDRQSRGDRLAFSSGVVRDVLYADLSRRKRRSLHRRFARQLEKRHAGRLEGVYPQLVYHFAEGDEPEKTVEYGLLHARKSLDSFSSDDAIRSAKAALDFLDDDWEGDPAVEGEARMLLARGHRMAGDPAGALREIPAAIKALDRRGDPKQMAAALLVAAKTAWQARKTDETRGWVERGIEVARAAGETDSLRQLLSLGATLANLRGESAKAGEYMQEAQRLAPGAGEDGSEEEIPRGGRLVVALSSPVSTIDPAGIKTVEEVEVLRQIYEPLLSTDADGNLVPTLCEKWEARESGRSFILTLRKGVHFQDGHPLTAPEVKQAFERSIRRTATDLAAAFAPLKGVSEFTAGRADEVAGIVVHSGDTLELQLDEALPIYPAMLTDARTGIARLHPEAEPADPTLAGTGPFHLASRDERCLVLERNERYWRGSPARLDAVEIRHGLGSSGIAAGLQSGELDMARDLLPQDLEQTLRDPRMRSGLVEAPQKNTYFILFNTKSGPVAANPTVRRALAGVFRAHDVVWRTLGRFAQPAAGLLPPGILGHDPGKRRELITLEQAQQSLSSADLESPLRLKAAVHPMIHDRYGSLLDAVFSVWADLGVEVAVESGDIASFLESWRSNDGLDMCILRWLADYDDPDSFTHTLFHSTIGQLRCYFGEEQADRILEEARAESRPSVREGLYRRFENQMLDSSALIPLFHDVDYRIVSPRVRGVKLGVAAGVNYIEIGKAEAVAPPERVGVAGGGIVRVPMTARVNSLDPSLASTVEQGEVLPTIFETLTRNLDAQIVPWLAESFRVEEGGRRYRFQLRDGIRFHDGRKLTARDVRYTFERLLQNSDADMRWLYSPIRGAKQLLDGERGDLEGFQIHSARAFSIELEEPIAFFPGLIAFHCTAIVPEGTERWGNSWGEGTVGTGPFRVARFEPGKRLELERNPAYWREGHPRSEGLVFSFGVSSAEILSGFRAGRFSLAADLFPQEVESLRRDAKFAAGYREAPVLSIYYAAFNTKDGPLRDEALRRKLMGAVDVARVVRQSLGQRAIPAHGLIPPGLLGHEPAHRREGLAVPATAERPTELELTAVVHPVFNREYAALYDRISKAFREVGVKLKPVTESMAEYLEFEAQAKADLSLGRWIADYPDADTFVHMLHTREGKLGRLCGSAEIDRLIARGRVETDPQARHATYRQVEEIIAREARFLPFFHEQVYRFAHPELEGLTVSDWTPTVAYDELRLRGG